MDDFLCVPYEISNEWSQYSYRIEASDDRSYEHILDKIYKINNTVLCHRINEGQSFLYTNPRDNAIVRN